MNGLKTTALLCALLLIASPAAANAEDEPSYRGDYIRLHVVADDDSALKQGEKLAVRDSVRQAANNLLAGCDTADEAFARLSTHADDLKSAALAVLDDEDGVSIETGVFAFPDRQYGALFLPAGEYRAVRVVLGRGEGHNWWCVLYPSLCLEVDGENEKTVIFYSSVARWLESLFAGDKVDTWPIMPRENILSAASWLIALDEPASDEAPDESAESQPDSAEVLPAMETAFPQQPMPRENVLDAASWLSVLGEPDSGEASDKNAESQPDIAGTLPAMETASPQPPISARTCVRAADRRGAVQEAIA